MNSSQKNSFFNLGFDPCPAQFITNPWDIMGSQNAAQQLYAKKQISGWRWLTPPRLYHRPTKVYQATEIATVQHIPRFWNDTGWTIFDVQTCSNMFKRTQLFPITNPIFCFLVTAGIFFWLTHVLTLTTLIPWNQDDLNFEEVMPPMFVGYMDYSP